MHYMLLKFILTFAKKAAMYLLQGVLSEIFIKEFIIYTLYKLSKKTTNKVDDKVVDALKKSFNIHKDVENDAPRRN